MNANKTFCFWHIHCACSLHSYFYSKYACTINIIAIFAMSHLLFSTMFVALWNIFVIHEDQMRAIYVLTHFFCCTSVSCTQLKLQNSMNKRYICNIIRQKVSATIQFLVIYIYIGMLQDLNFIKIRIYLICPWQNC